ncbi:ABC transporter substrate-binding protein [Actinoplanes sp. NEAU-A12]|uniref:ABC transporter substrate-binding protein n=1 Tax=Actinoplanes sandaracinus TaxID=3045177 RepID=A0ABT6X1D6_9ACTN|nr:ABC transporter substrate-binding protein [Actinoplanes sandaracinus]MDI6105822.1 ABC transporter substrate-binding protein [Actinoplanes sandaracinus]
MTTRRSAIAALLTLTTLAACGGPGSAAASGEQVKELRYQGWVGAVTPAELAESLGYLGDVKLKWIGNTISGPQDIQAATTGDTDFGGAFNGAIVKLKVSKAPITAVVSYYGSDKGNYSGFFVLENSPVKSARDLIGKKIGVNTLGAHSEAITKTYLTRAGLTPEEIKQVELIVVPPVNTEQSLRAGQIDVAALSGTLRDVAIEHGGIRPLYTDVDLLGDFNGGSYVLRDDFIKKNPDTVRRFTTAVAKAVDWSRDQPVETVRAKFEEIIAKRGRNEDTKQVKFWKSYGVVSPGGKIADTDFSVWIDWLNGTGELKKNDLKPADLYTNDYNDLAKGGAAG